MKQPSTPPDDWQPCSPGTIGSHSRVEIRQSRRALLFSLAGVCTGGVLVGAAALLSRRSVPQDFSQPLPGITLTKIGCQEVRLHLVNYVGDEISDCELIARIARHLDHCNSCQTAYEKLITNDDEPCLAVPEFDQSQIAST